MDADDHLIRQIATDAADYAIGAFGQSLPKGQQLRLWKRYYDSALSSLITFQHLQQDRRTRAFAEASVN